MSTITATTKTTTTTTTTTTPWDYPCTSSLGRPGGTPPSVGQPLSTPRLHHPLTSSSRPPDSAPSYFNLVPFPGVVTESAPADTTTSIVRGGEERPIQTNDNVADVGGGDDNDDETAPRSVLPFTTRSASLLGY